MSTSNSNFVPSTHDRQITSYHGDSPWDDTDVGRKAGGQEIRRGQEDLSFLRGLLVSPDNWKLAVGSWKLTQLSSTPHYNKRVTPRLSAALLVIVLGVAGGTVWYLYGTPDDEDLATEEGVEDHWLTDLYSQNPRVAEAAARRVVEMGEDAVPEIEEVLHDPMADVLQIKAAMKAAGILGPKASSLIPAIAEHLVEPGLTAEAAVALSYLGREAFPPLRDALDSADPVVRREALRSIGKLRDRAPLDQRLVVPVLVGRMKDQDPGVRTVAATYLGIIGADSRTVVPVLIAGLQDPSAEVRAAAATALGSFPEASKTIIPALRRALGDDNADVAREAGVSIVKLQGRGTQ